MDYCPKCHENLEKCEKCGKKFIPDDEEKLCSKCYKNSLKICLNCKKEFEPKKIEYKLCINCYEIKNNNDSIQNGEESSKDKRDLENRTIELLVKALQDPNSQEFAFQTLVEMGESAAEPLILTFEEPNKSKKLIRKILVEMGEKSLFIVIKYLDELSFDLKNNCIKVLGRIGDERAVQPLIKLFDDFDPTIRKNTAIALGRIGSIESIPALIKTTDDESSEVRKVVVHALGAINDESVTPALTEILLNDENSFVRSECVKSLGLIGSEECINSLCIALDDPNLYVKKEAEELIIKIKGENFLESLKNRDYKSNMNIDKEKMLFFIDKLLSGDLNEKIDAAESLGNMKHEKSAEYLLSAINDENEKVRSVAANSLGKIKYPFSIKPLISLLNDTNEVRMASEEAIVNFGSEALEEISQAMLSAEDDVRYALVMIAGEIEGDEATNILIESLNDQDIDIRIKALALLGLRKEELAIPALKNILEKDYEEEDFLMKKSTIKCLEKIGGEKSLEILSDYNEHNDALKKIIGTSVKRINKKIDKKAAKIENEKKIESNEEELVNDEFELSDEIFKEKNIEIQDKSDYSDNVEEDDSIDNPFDLIDKIQKPLDD